jgi:hypothetical protein
MTELKEAKMGALNEPLDDEYKAWATYGQVIADFGKVAPFRHIAGLRTVVARYRPPMPENSWPGRVPRFAGLAEACAASVAAEIENATPL